MHYEIEAILKNHGFEQRLVDEIVTVGRLKKVTAGQVVARPGDGGNEMPIVLTGVLRVARQDANGDEIFLYSLQGGETCAMSVSCCLEGKKAAYKLTAEQDATMWMVPMDYLDSWMAAYPSFRRFVIRAYQDRFEELLLAVDSIAFTKLDERLLKYLLDTKQATGSFEINKTHEQIARDLNSSRVVISRLLKKMEEQDIIEQHRNKIEIL